jgi:hypothetical protein
LCGSRGPRSADFRKSESKRLFAAWGVESHWHLVGRGARIRTSPSIQLSVPGSVGATRHLRIRARGAPGQVAGAAKYNASSQFIRYLGLALLMLPTPLSRLPQDTAGELFSQHAGGAEESHAR